MTRGIRCRIRTTILSLTIAAASMATQPASATFACSQSGGHVSVILNLNATGRLFLNAAGQVVLAAGT